MLSRLAQFLALAALFASVCVWTAEASSHPFSDPPQQKEVNASTVAARPLLPKCASSSSSTCVLAAGGGGDQAKDSWPALDASYAGTQWLAPPQIPSTLKASDSYYQIAKLPLSRSACSPGSEVEARLVLRFPVFRATESKADAMAEQQNTAGIMATSNPLAAQRDGKTRRCVLAGVRENASAAEAAAGAREAERAATAASSFSEAKCVECNSFVTTSGSYVRCPAVPGVWYVDRLPLRVPAAASGWCDDGGGGGGGGSSEKAQALVENERTLGQNYASFVVNAGSEVEVALFDVVGRSSGPGAPSA